MKNIYLYGQSDDLREIETDFDNGFESDSGNIYINGVYAHYEYNGDWGVALLGPIPETWIVRSFDGNMPSQMRGLPHAGQFIHIQVPDDEEIIFKETEA